MKTPTRLKIAALGCGSRTKIYAQIAALMRDLYEFVAIADPVPERRQAIKQLTGRSDIHEYASAEDFLAEPKQADLVIIATQDHQHREQAIAAMERGYDLLLEKPIATSLEDVLAVERAAIELGRRVVVCHVLRYAPFYKKVKELIESGALGNVVSIQATEGVGTFHQAHSFVRGHWAREEESSPMILAKACHDLDILYWLANSRSRKVSSFAGVAFFKPENAPSGATDNCMNGCPHVGACAFDAHRYLSSEQKWLQYIMPNLAASGQTPGETLAWIKQSPWGRCVYKCQNTAVDHQVTLLEFENNITATFTMTAFAKGRTIEIYGSKACLRGGEFYRETFGCDFVITQHDGSGEERVKVDFEDVGYAGHGGGDYGLMQTLHSVMTSPREQAGEYLISHSTESHRMAFAAHESRMRGGELVFIHPKSEPSKPARIAAVVL